MEKKGKKFLQETLKVVLGLTVISLMLGAVPYCKGILANPNHYIVTDTKTTCQPIEENGNSTILVEFQCEEKDFPKLLCEFTSAHKELEFRIAEINSSKDPYCKKGIVVTFFKK